MFSRGSKSAHSRTALAVTKQVLQEQWKRLELKPATLLHLQELLDTNGVASAAAVTDVLVREKRLPITTVGKEWSFAELRLISLEGMRPHVMEGLRAALETLMAWHLISLPAGSLEHAIQLILAVLYVGGAIVGVCLLCRYRSRKSVKLQPPS